MPSLRDKTISGIFWSFLQKAGSRGIQLVITIVLARLLTPKDFGLIGMLAIFISLSQTLVRAGFSQALIQKKDTDEEDYSSVFYINLTVCLCVYLILFFTAPLIANFYDQQALISLTRVLSSVFVINAFSYVQETRLKKNVDFKKLMYFHLPSTVFSGAVAIGMAFSGYGVWSIVGQQVTMRLAYTIQIWIYSKWKPLLKFNKKKAKDLFSFGSKLMLSGIMTTLYNNIYLVIIGKFYPVSNVGYYRNAFTLVDVPSNTITTILGDVSFPVLSSIQDENKRLKAGYKRLIQQVVFWVCPLFIISGVLAEPLIRFVLGDKWLPTVPYFQWLCIVGVFGPLNSYNLSIVNVKGRSDMWLKLQFIRRFVTIVAIALVYSYGITALLIVQASSVVFAYILFSHFAGRFIDYDFIAQIKDLFPIFILNILIGFFVLLIAHLLNGLPVLPRLLLCVSVGGGTYFLLSKWFRLLPYRDFEDILKNKVLKLIKKNA